MPACTGVTPRRRKPNIRSVAPGPAAWETPNGALHNPRVSRRRQQFRAYAVICANGLLLTALSPRDTVRYGTRADPGRFRWAPPAPSFVNFRRDDVKAAPPQPCSSRTRLLGHRWTGFDVRSKSLAKTTGDA